MRKNPLGYLIEFHMSDEVKAMDRDDVAPTRVGPFVSYEEADDFAEAHMRFYDRAEVVGILEGVMLPQEWIAGQEDDDQEYQERD